MSQLGITSKCSLVAGAAMLLSFAAAPIHAQGVPPGSSDPALSMTWMSSAANPSTAAGAALGIAAQAFLVVVIIGDVMPLFGLGLLDMARGVAAFNLPARVGQLFGVGL